MRLQAFGESNLKDPEAAMGRWQDSCHSFPGQEGRAVWFPRICPAGMMAFAVKGIVKIRVEQTPRPEQGQDVDSLGLNLWIPHTPLLPIA